MRLAQVLFLLAALAACGAPDREGSSDAASGNAPPRIDVAVPTGYVGYDEDVTLDATVTDPEGGQITLEWAQIGGEPLDLSSTTGTSLSFHTHALEALIPVEDGRIRVVPVSRREAGHYRFGLTARDALGATSVAEVEVRAGGASPGWPRAEQGVPTLLDAGIAQDRYQWEVTFSPPRSEPRLLEPTARRPRLVITGPGRYMVREQVSGRELAVHAGPWMGTRQCGRVECHPVETRGWALTKMASVAQRGLDGELRDDYRESCLRCHTVGWNPASANDGFDDVAAAEGWVFPARLERGNHARLSETLADRSGVGCESCHGPGRFYTSYSADVCASCHDQPPDYENPSEWRRAPMSKIREGVVGRPACERCHTAQAFLDEWYGHEPAPETAREEDVQFAPEAVTCGVCHDTHAGDAPRLVRHSGPLYGQDPDDVDWGNGTICLACHHGGAQWADEGGALMRPFVPREKHDISADVTLWRRRRVPHAPQGEVVRGRAGHALPGPGPIDASPPHLTVPGGCLGCHVRVRPPEGSDRRGLVGGHTFAMFHGEREARVENPEACAPCHGPLESLSRPARHDYDGDGRVEGIYEEVDGLLERTRAAIDAAIARTGITEGGRRAAGFAERDECVVLVDAEGQLLGGPDAPVTLPAEEERLYRAIFNYLVVVKDRSHGVHNPVLTVRLLQRTTLRLAPRDVPRWYWR